MASRSRTLGKAFLAGLFVLGVCEVQGQTGSAEVTAGQAPRAPIEHIRSASPDGLFRIDVELKDAEGNPVTDLAAEDFTVFDNGQPTRIFTLDSGGTSSEPVPELIFVFDTINLSPIQLAQTKSAIGHFLLRNSGTLEFPCFLYRLTRDGLYSSVKPTRDGTRLARELEQNKSPRIVWKGSAFGSLGEWGAGMNRNQLSLRALGSIAIDQRKVAGRKVLVWISPGWPVNGGDNGFDEATELSTRLRDARIAVDSVNIWPEPDPFHNWHDFAGAPRSQKDMRPERMALPAIATRTGGLVMESQEDLEKYIERCAADARIYYTLTFSPPRTDQVDEYHGLRVEVARPGVIARTADGYYNEPVYFDHSRPGVERVPVTGLEEVVQSGRDLGRRLTNLELTERLSTPRLESLLSVVHGERERQALIVAADLSIGLPPPADEVVNQPVPGVAEQRAILLRTLDYLLHSIPKLPDFFALRNTVRYGEPAQREGQTWKIPPPDQTLRFASSEHATVLYRNGNEVIEKRRKISKQTAGAQRRNLETWGTFGPILSCVLNSMARGGRSITWKRWETGKNGEVAVFSLNLAGTTNAFFEVTYCCIPEGDGTAYYRSLTGYSGEVAVDPATGAILRLAITADLDEDRNPTVPIVRSQVMVEYGPEELGGKTYICPRRSVSLSRGRTVTELHEWSMGFRIYSYFETMINDVTFGGYHKFGTESRILPGFEEAPGGDGSGSKPTPKPH